MENRPVLIKISMNTIRTHCFLLLARAAHGVSQNKDFCMCPRHKIFSCIICAKILAPHQQKASVPMVRAGRLSGRHIQLKMEHMPASEHHRIKAKNVPKSRLGPPPRRQPPRRMSCAHYFQLLLFRSKKQSRECQRQALSLCQPACLPSV
jgi:hypothetical protein